ncbi:MAG: hypothetical protein V4584_09035 [Verrucomicrobiota bacterium]
MNSPALLLAAAMTLLVPALAMASPREDLASPSQEVRDKAAAELRASFRSTPESGWTPVLDQISKGQTKKQIMELLRPYHVTVEPEMASGQTHAESYRLDDEWILQCGFLNEGDILTGRALARSIRQVHVTPPGKFTGKWVLYFANGQKSHEILYQDGNSPESSSPIIRMA